MSYAGNPSLTPDVQERISNTFQQTLDLVTQGKEQEALVGCEFILRMDPAFGPANRLLQRLRSDQRPVRLDDLRAGEPDFGDLDDDAPDFGDPDFGDPGGLGSLDDLSDFSEPSFAGLGLGDPPDEPDAPAAPTAAPASGLSAMVEDLLQKRKFEQILQIAESRKDEIANEPAVQKLVESARSRIESDAYVKAFVKSAAQARDSGQSEEMEAFLSKARSLDPNHPEVLGFSKQARSRVPSADDDLATLQMQSLQLDAGEAEDLPDLDDLVDLDDLGEDDFGDDSFEPDDEPLESADVELLDGFEPPNDPEPGPREAGGDAEGGDRISQLLAEGQEIYQRGEYQAAIDVWSRIFLIDIDNSEASNRIERARSKKAELERQAEEIFHEGVAQIQASSLEEARESLRRVLDLQPSHTMAREYLQQLEAGQVPAIKAQSDELGEITRVFDGGLGGEESAQSMDAAVERDRIVVVKKTDKRLIAAGALVAVLVAGGIYFLATGGLDDLFPNRKAPPPVVRVDAIERATKMQEGGNTENAILLLERVQPDDPSYEDAQALLVQWKAQVETPVEEVATGPSQEQIERFDLLLTAAREAHAQNNFLRARKYFDRASKISPLSAEAFALKRECDQALRPLEEAIELFENAEYSEAIPLLWRMREEDPVNPDVEQLLINSYYNFALSDLQRGDPMAAAKKLQEALEVQPDNRELQRMRLFAQTYADRQRDLLYRIFVKYLPSRS
jgi:tetratricopeptide (TPR) repeat protein